jgi:hypothetical protein
MVENRFIDYFDESTEIYQGMLLLDEELGGTATLDIIINEPKEALDDVIFEDILPMIYLLMICLQMKKARHQVIGGIYIH